MSQPQPQRYPPPRSQTMPISGNSAFCEGDDIEYYGGNDPDDERKTRGGNQNGSFPVQGKQSAGTSGRGGNAAGGPQTAGSRNENAGWGKDGKMDGKMDDKKKDDKKKDDKKKDDKKKDDKKKDDKKKDDKKK